MIDLKERLWRPDDSLVGFHPKNRYAKAKLESLGYICRRLKC